MPNIKAGALLIEIPIMRAMPCVSGRCVYYMTGVCVCACVCVTDIERDKVLELVTSSIIIIKHWPWLTIIHTSYNFPSMMSVCFVACVYVYVHSCFCYVVGTFSLVMNTVSVWLYKGNERHWCANKADAKRCIKYVFVVCACACACVCVCVRVCVCVCVFWDLQRLGPAMVINLQRKS